MRFRIEVDGDPGLIMAEKYTAGALSAKSAMLAVGREVQLEWRRQIGAAGLGTRLSNSIRARAYPEQAASLNAAALVWTKAPEIIDAFNRGVTIRGRDGFWLAIPLPAAGAGRGGRRITPGEWQFRTGIRLRFVYRRGRTALLVADEARVRKRGTVARKGGRRRQRDGILPGAQTVPVFLLVPQVTLQKRLNLYPAAERIAAGVSLRIVRGWRDT